MIGSTRFGGGRAKTAGHVVAYAALALGMGALAGVIWAAVVELPAYQVAADGGATTSERGLAAVIAGDAWFAVIGLVAGGTLGWVAWRRLDRLGWPLVLLAIAAALVAGAVCWAVGYQLGPGPFDPRLAAARPGDQVPIELTVRARAALLVWPLGAVIPVLLGAALATDAEEVAGQLD